jgi:hypothetical protein
MVNPEFATKNHMRRKRYNGKIHQHNFENIRTICCRHVCSTDVRTGGHNNDSRVLNNSLIISPKWIHCYLSGYYPESSGRDRSVEFVGHRRFMAVDEGEHIDPDSVISLGYDDVWQFSRGVMRDIRGLALGNQIPLQNINFSAEAGANIWKNRLHFPVA